MLTKVHSNLTPTQKKYLEAVSEGIENALSAKDIAILADVSAQASYAMLSDLFDAGLLERIGRGGKWDPYRYFKIKTKHPAVGTAVVPDPTWNVENSDAVSKVAEMLNDFKALFEERNLLREENKKLKTRLENVEKALLD